MGCFMVTKALGNFYGWTAIELALGCSANALALVLLLVHWLPEQLALLAAAALVGLLLGAYGLSRAGNSTQLFFSKSQWSMLVIMLLGVASSWFLGLAAGLCLALVLSPAWGFFALHTVAQRHLPWLSSACALLLASLHASHEASGPIWLCWCGLFSAWLVNAGAAKPVTCLDKSPWHKPLAGLCAWLICSALSLCIYASLPRFTPAQLSSASTPSTAISSTQGPSALQSLQQDWLLQQEAFLPPDTPSAPAAVTPGGFYYPAFHSGWDISQQPSREPGLALPIAWVSSRSPVNLAVNRFDSFDGQRWHNSSQAQATLRLQQERLLLNPKPGAWPVQIRLRSSLGRFIPMAGDWSELLFPSPTLQLDAQGQLQAPQPLVADMRYEMHINLKHWRGRRIGDSQNLLHPRYRQLPEQLPPQLLTLAQKITQGAQQDFDKAQAIEQHLRANLRPSIAAVVPSYGRDPLLYCLEETQACSSETAATSMALMLRSLGIPARLVSGFATYRQDPFTGLFRLQGQDAHTWVEAFVDNQGWLEYEPSAAYPVPLAARASLFGWSHWHQWLQQQQQLAHWTPVSNPAWFWWVSGFIALALVFVFAALGYSLFVLINHRHNFSLWRQFQAKRLAVGKTPVSAEESFRRLMCLMQLAGHPLTRRGIEDWARLWQTLLADFDADTFCNCYYHHHFGLNTQGDLAQQQTQLLQGLLTLPWKTLSAGSPVASPIASASF
jgi:hypothetical protein